MYLRILHMLFLAQYNILQKIRKTTLGGAIVKH